MDPLLVTIYCYTFFGLIGLCVGSFLNVLIYRWPEGMSIVSPPSHCTKCDYQLKWYDNIPVISYIMLGGKCRKCGEHISIRYTIVEITNCLLWILSYNLNSQNIPLAVIYALVTSIFICIFFIDIEHKIILDRFNISIAVLALIRFFFVSKEYGNLLNAVLDGLLGSVIAGGFFLLMFYFSLVVLKKEGLGGGDIKFMFATGLLLGWKNIFLSVLIASLSAAIILTVAQKVRKDDKDHEYPFAPYLVIGAVISMFFGTQLINFYLSLF